MAVPITGTSSSAFVFQRKKCSSLKCDECCRLSRFWWFISVFKSRIFLQKLTNVELFDLKITFRMPLLSPRFSFTFYFPEENYFHLDIFVLLIFNEWSSVQSYFFFLIVEGKASLALEVILHSSEWCNSWKHSHPGRDPSHRPPRTCKLDPPFLFPHTGIARTGFL